MQVQRWLERLAHNVGRHGDVVSLMGIDLVFVVLMILSDSRSCICSFRVDDAAVADAAQYYIHKPQSA